jgi:hypothetical protein
MNFLLITFNSTHLAIKTEKQLMDLNVEMIPTPRQLSASCGLSLKGPIEVHEEVKKRMGQGYNLNSQCYMVETTNEITNFRKV